MSLVPLIKDNKPLPSLIFGDACLPVKKLYKNVKMCYKYSKYCFSCQRRNTKKYSHTEFAVTEVAM